MDRTDPHYRAIAQFYGNRTTTRSGVPLIQHIHEGLQVLDAIGASVRAHQAFCLHPLLQKDDALQASLTVGSAFLSHELRPDVIAVTMEYRQIANAYLSAVCSTADDVIRLSSMSDVNDMLIADKVQNRKDFEIHHAATHPRRDVLALYFRNWLRRLGISEQRYQELRDAITGE